MTQKAQTLEIDRSHRSVNWLESSPFIAIHLAALGVFFVPFQWSYFWIFFFSYYIGMFGITAGFHRYFAHRTYKVSRLTQFVWAILGCLAGQKDPLWWASHHRFHHRFSDQVNDAHSPVQHGFWWSHFYWYLGDDYKEVLWDQVPDLAKYPELRWLNKHHVLPQVAAGIAFYWFGGWGVFFWGFALASVARWQCTSIINSLCHVYGSRRYATTDTSRNNLLFALLTMGEGWHNNHHCYQSSVNQGFYWYEVDFSYYIIKFLSFFGVARDLRKPPLELLQAKRIDRGVEDLTMSIWSSAKN